MVIVLFSRIYSALNVAFKFIFNGKVNPKYFIDLHDRDSTSLFNSNKSSSRYFDRNLNYLTTILHVCYAVYFQLAFAIILPNNMWASDVTNKYIRDLTEQHKTASESVFSQCVSSSNKYIGL